jgi:hypothetical protein
LVAIVSIIYFQNDSWNTFTCFLAITGIDENPAKYPPYPAELYPPLIPAVTAFVEVMVRFPDTPLLHRLPS